MKYELIKRLKRDSKRWYEKGQVLDIDEIKAKSLMAAGYIADPNKPIIKTKIVNKDGNN